MKADRLTHHRNNPSSANPPSLLSTGGSLPSDAGKLRFLLQKMCRGMCLVDTVLSLVSDLYFMRYHTI
jgi:hypothetical protein